MQSDKKLNAARAVVDGVSTPPVYLSNNGFTDAGLSRTATGTYRLTLPRPVNTARCEVQITPVAPSAGVYRRPMGYSWISTTVIEVEVYNSSTQAPANLDFSISIKQVT